MRRLATGMLLVLAIVLLAAPAWAREQRALSSQTSSGDKELTAASVAERKAGEAADKPLQKRTAEAITAIFGASLLFAGFAVCITIAVRDPVEVNDAAA